MGIIKKDGINYTAPSGGSGGGGSSDLKVEFITEEDYLALEAEGEVDLDTEYLITDPEDERVIKIAYQYSERSNQTPQRGTHVEDIDIGDWNNLIEDPSDPVWDNCSVGYYFIWDTDGDNRSLIKIASVTYDEGNWGSYIFPVDNNRQIHLMEQVDYDTIISDGGIPVGFSYCTDTRNFYYQDSVIVENTPPVP